MLKELAKQAAGMFGLEVRRQRDASLPFVHRITCDGDTFGFWIANEHAKRWWHKPELHFNAELRCLKAMCAVGSVVFDVGAHHGLATVLFSRWVGSAGHVYAFEANAENALVLGANVALNRLANCTCVHAVVGADAGISRMVGETVAAPGVRDGRPVERISLDEYVLRTGLRRVDLVKIDVEGFEAEVLKGARRVLAMRPKVDIEIHLDELARFGASRGAVLDLLEFRQYEAFMMIRPDWETLLPLHSPTELPGSGVVNLFLWPS